MKRNVEKTIAEWHKFYAKKDKVSWLKDSKETKRYKAKIVKTKRVKTDKGSLV